MPSKKKLENTINIPNALTLLRFILTFVLLGMFIFDFPVLIIMYTFIFAAITDFLDGQIARGFRQVTKFGAKFDVIADRMLWITTGLCLLIFFPLRGIFDSSQLLQMALIMTREILCAPFTLINLSKHEKVLVPARWSGKITTFLQGFAIPAVILSVYYPYFDMSIILAVITSLFGVWAATEYIPNIGFFKKK